MYNITHVKLIAVKMTKKIDFDLNDYSLEYLVINSGEFLINTR